MNTTYSTAREAIWDGFVVFGLCSLWGMRLLFRGLRGDIFDSFRTAVASRGWFVVGGMLLQLPLAGFTLFAWKQGLFSS